MGRVTGFDALEAMNGYWGATPDPGAVRCPVCGDPVRAEHWRRLAHLRTHLRTGWRPADTLESYHEQDRFRQRQDPPAATAGGL